MTDIWDEKPDVYLARNLDAWLEKVKFEYHKAETAVDYLMEVSLKSGKKLEALEKLHPELIDILNMDWIWLSKPPLDRLLKWEDRFEEILQSSTPKVKRPFKPDRSTQSAVTEEFKKEVSV